MKLLFSAIFSAIILAAPAMAKVHIVPQGRVCALGNDMVIGITDNQCKILNYHANGKIVRGCVVRGTYVPQLSEDQCDLIDGVWTWVKP